jgi:hypothetical protein
MRKKTLLYFFSTGILVSAILVLSCEREILDPNLFEDQSSVQIDGVLSFNSFEEFSQTANILNTLTFPELEKWCVEKSFTSQEYLFQKLIQEEDKYEEDIIKQYGEDVTSEYLTSELNLSEHPT